MLVIVTAEITLAKKLDECLEGDRTFVLRPHIPQIPVDDDDPYTHPGQQAMRASIYPHTPEVVVLDVRFGGNHFRAMRSVPRIASGATRPAMILLIPRRTKAVVKEAARMGVFEVISLSVRAWKKNLIEAIRDAQAARRAGLLQSPARFARGSLH